MAVHTYLLDFTVDKRRFETIESRKLLEETVEQGLTGFLSGLKKETTLDIDSGFLCIYSDPRGVCISVRGYRQGIITVNIEYYKPDQEENIVLYDKVCKIASVLKNSLIANRYQRLPAITRGSHIDKYFLSMDERILEYDIDKIVFEEKSAYQKIQIVHSKTLGNILILDELPNMSESDLIYTETLMQRGHENYEEKEVIILGGGDGCLLWELLKEKPKFVTMLELDEVVIKACAKYLRSACGDCLDNYQGKRYKIIVGDCFETLQVFIEQGKKVDYVFGDLTDIPVDTTEHGEVWNFVRSILNMAMKVIKPGGKYMTHGNGASVPKSLVKFENVLNSLAVPVEVGRSSAFVPSFLEDWVFYHVTPIF